VRIVIDYCGEAKRTLQDREWEGTGPCSRDASSQTGGTIAHPAPAPAPDSQLETATCEILVLIVVVVWSELKGEQTREGLVLFLDALNCKWLQD
jgi:hypothetical protein